jgi:hypothetical protein
MENILPQLETPVQIRPRFKVITQKSVAELTERLKNALAQSDAPCEGHVAVGYGKIYPPHKTQHYWSPQLTFSLETTEEGTVLRGMYGPRPTVWTMFVFFYALIAFAAVVIAIIGLSYWTLGKSLMILFVLPVLIIAFLSLYFVAYSGQKLGHDEIITLHRFMEKTLSETIH